MMASTAGVPQLLCQIEATALECIPASNNARTPALEDLHYWPDQLASLWPDKLA